MHKTAFPSLRSVGSLEELISETALAKRWNVSVRTMQRRRDAGNAPPYMRLGRAILYRVSDVAAFEAARTVSTGDRA